MAVLSVAEGTYIKRYSSRKRLLQKYARRDIRIHKIKMYKKYMKSEIYIYFLYFCNLYCICNVDIVKMQRDTLWQIIVSERIKKREYDNE